MKTLLKKAIRAAGVEVISSTKLEYFKQAEKDRKSVMDMVAAQLSPDLWRAQLQQDVFVALSNGFKRGGFFVEFGATDGVLFSNSHALEKGLGWHGILSEPAPIWHDALYKNRSCMIDTRCVWPESGQSVPFTVASNPELSGVTASFQADNTRDDRAAQQTLNVETISLTDLLKDHDAPSFVDYLSIDTEGSEYEILRAHDFDAYSFGIITCEHNFTAKRQDIFELLTSKGYKRVLPTIANWDDWYVLDA